MENVPHPARELALIDQELHRMETRRGQLLTRRSYLVTVLARPAAPPPATHATASTASPASPAAAPPSAQNVLLTLGGVLLTVAATAFTLVSWGHLGIGGRSAVLTVITLAALAVPAVLLRRGLSSTAEAVAAFGLVLTVLDAYALHAVALSGVDGLRYTAVACAVLAALWGGYGALLGGLRGPLPAAVVTAQLPLLLWSVAGGWTMSTVAWALLATAVLDTAVALWPLPRRTANPARHPSRRAARGLVVAAAFTTAGVALFLAAWSSVDAGTPAAMAEPALLLLTGAALGLFVARRAPEAAFVCAAGAGLALVVAVGGPLRTVVPAGWAVLGYLLCAVGLLALVRTRLPRRVRQGLGAAGGAVTAVSLPWALPSVVATLLGGATRVTEIWSGVPDGTRAALGVRLASSWQLTAPLVLATAAGTLFFAYRLLPRLAPDIVPVTDVRRSRTAALCGAGVLGWATVLVVPIVWDLPYAVALVVPLVLTAVALALAVRPRGPMGTAGALTALIVASAGAASVAPLSLATRPATLTVLVTLSALFAAAAVALRSGPVQGRDGSEGPALGEPVRALLACVCVGLTTALVVAGSAAAGLPVATVAVTVLAVPAAVALLGARLREHPVAVPVEITGGAAGLLAAGLALGSLPVLALVLALGGVIAAGTAVRVERRRVAGYAATALFVAATWVRLGASGVSVPEAYTLPVTVAALAVGAVRRRRDPAASSWTAYGPGLAATLAPSLLAAWGDPHWARPLLLGLAALALTLAGARLRLRAPLVLGGAVLALVALHELAPYVVQVVGALPRWLPPALAGLLLLGVGATYEQRLRDARRVRRSLGRMR
ncbi:MULTISPECIES: SCO7613 C-terminal domain-containing membrane protein [unclassified Streptomyces]|uniref:SCO7613 C-terminal domain-containing membrane protein n=1 Tax=unclassified Streptomyces TaxID=2593676 RepID=UPI0037F92A6F